MLERSRAPTAGESEDNPERTHMIKQTLALDTNHRQKTSLEHTKPAKQSSYSGTTRN